MPVFNFRLKQTTDPGVRLLGPTAQDFRAAFSLGENDTTINSGNEMGVALAAIKGLYRELQDRDGTIAELRAKTAAADTRAATQDAKIAALRDRFAEQKAVVAAMQGTVARLLKAAKGLREAELTEP
jgi:uncharacterized coiled-coil protein SlyX